MQQIDGYRYENTPSLPGLGVQDFVAILWRRKWILAVILIAATAVSYRLASNRKPSWTATAQMIVTERGTAISTTTETNSTGPMQNGAVESPQTQIGMILSDGMAERTLNRLKNDALASGRPMNTIGTTSPEQFRLDFLSAVKVVNPLDTNLLEVSVNADNPEKAATWANAVCQAFVQWKKELAKRTVQDIADNLEVRASKAREQMVDAERRETIFKQTHHLVDVPAQQRAALEQYVQRESDASTARQEFNVAQATLQSIQAQLNTMNTAMRNGTDVRNDEDVMRLQAQLHDLQSQRNAAAQKYTKEYPNILPGLDAQIKDLQDRITKSVQTTADNKVPSLLSQASLTEQYKQAQRNLDTARAKVISLEHLRDDLKARLAGMPQAALEYARLTRNTVLAQQLYSSLQLSLNSARLNMDSAVGNVQITQAAYLPLVPSGTPASRAVLVGILLGALLAVGAALVVEHGDHRIRTVDRVRHIVPGPVIGTLPRMSRWQIRKTMRGTPPPQAVEAYSLACASLMLAMRNNAPDDSLGHAVVLITSAAPNEGKSMTAAEMARFMARSGRSVILVDGDMRRPTQDRLFDIEPSPGLAEILEGKMTINETLLDIGEPNLRLLSSGTPGRSPIHLLSSARIGEVLSGLRTEAEVVIVDSPASNVVADALLLAAHVDCIVQVVAMGMVDEKLVRQTTEALQMADPQTFAFFVNRAPRDRRRAYQPYYFQPPVAAQTNNGSRPQLEDRLPVPSDAIELNDDTDPPTGG